MHKAVFCAAFSENTRLVVIEKDGSMSRPRSIIGRFSLTKPLVLPGVSKDTLVNAVSRVEKTPVTIVVVWRPHHYQKVTGGLSNEK